MRIANPSQIRIASTPESSISLSLSSLPSLRDARLGLGRHGRRPRRIGPRARTAEAWPPRHEQRRVIEDERERRALAVFCQVVLNKYRIEI